MTIPVSIVVVAVVLVLGVTLFLFRRITGLLLWTAGWPSLCCFSASWSPSGTGCPSACLVRSRSSCRSWGGRSPSSWMS